MKKNTKKSTPTPFYQSKYVVYSSLFLLYVYSLVGAFYLGTLYFEGSFNKRVSSKVNLYNTQTKTTLDGEQICGGFAGNLPEYQCAEGYECVIDSDMVDATGVCKEI